MRVKELSALEIWKMDKPEVKAVEQARTAKKTDKSLKIEVTTLSIVFLVSCAGLAQTLFF